MKKDAVDEMLDQWSQERPDLDTTSLGVAVRVMTLYRSFSRQAAGAWEPRRLDRWNTTYCLRCEGREGLTRYRRPGWRGRRV